MFGNSRLLRPPLGYGTAAVIAKVRGTTVYHHEPRYYSYRLANAFFGALTIALTYATVTLLFNSALVGLLGSLLVGLMPQFTFIASYLNDDSAAIAAVSLIVFSMAKIVRNGASFSNCLLFALSIGVTIISKKAAWVFLPSAILFYLGFILRFERGFFSKHIAMAIVFILAGGWWLVFNMYQYGWNDPILSKVIGRASWENTELDLNQFGTIAVHGIGVSELLLGNFGNFIGKSYIAFVGLLDWVKLRVGPAQYSYYLFIAFGLVANLLFLTIEAFQSRLQNKRVWLEIILYISCISQILAYAWANAFNDIQVQGKYIIPVILPMLILSLSFYAKLMQWLFKHVHFLQTQASQPLKIMVASLVIISPVIIHLDALIHYVAPFYWPDTALWNLEPLY